MSDAKQYGKRDVEQLDYDGNYFFRHVLAMTAERLHSKTDIAAELAYRDRRIAELEAELAEREGWQPIETAPPQKAVLLHYKTEYGFWLTIRAEFVPEETRDVDDQPYDGDAVYDKVTDRHWWPEGWYELIDNWGDMSCVMVHGAPYRWMPLPAAPDSAT